MPQQQQSLRWTHMTMCTVSVPRPDTQSLTGRGHEQCKRSLCDDQVRPNLVCNQSHGACCFSMIKTARTGAMVAMGQAVVNGYSCSQTIQLSVAPRGVLKSWGGWWYIFKCYYSGTWSWVKPFTIPESPSIDLYNTCLVEGLSSLCALCGAFTYFN